MSESDANSLRAASAPGSPAAAGGVAAGDIGAMVLDLMPNGVAFCRMLYEGTVPVDYVHLYTNPAFHTQTGLGPIGGRPISEVIPGLRQTNPDLFEIYARVAAGGPPQQFETFVAALHRWFQVQVFCPLAGHFVAIFDDITQRRQREEQLRLQSLVLDQVQDLRTTLVRDESGQPLAMVGVGTDITERLAAERALRASEERYRTAFQTSLDAVNINRVSDGLYLEVNPAFLANMSHEIRNPLNAITGMTCLLKRAGVAPAQAARLDHIETAGRHLLAIIDAVLDLSKIESGRLDLHTAEVDLGRLTARVAALLRDRAQAKQVQLLLDTQVPPGPLLGDPTRLQQALLNYAGNAVKFTQTGSVILRTRVDREDGERVCVRFEVQDTGIGIPAHSLPKLFSTFEQLDNSITRRFGTVAAGSCWPRTTRSIAR